MALEQSGKIGSFVIILGFLSFILAIVAENKKPPFGTPIQGNGVVICKFPSDPTVLVDSLSVVALVFTIIGGHVTVFFNYKGKAVSNNVLFGYSALFVFFVIAEIVSTLAFAFLIWTVVTEGLHRSRNVHYDLTTQCPTAKTGMFGGAAFLALDAAILWLVCLTLTLNVRADHFEDEEVKKGEYGQVYATELVSQGA
ncbi:uncharacterized protein LOC122013550 [Zingiber officinale]|uniref:Uncharacterized protein n=1 Tax=Zingiber officinale TaxID=94328 RepID=A0A8J5F7P3_ZINOF|nr:uncharacterized protein LOC122013550 [Zingiber officinale]KAG6481499.1 hypothetical protein ZIOFF_058103 [Zingiber officinale]